jgi:hypothetical protein
MKISFSAAGMSAMTGATTTASGSYTFGYEGDLTITGTHPIAIVTTTPTTVTTTIDISVTGAGTTAAAGTVNYKTTASGTGTIDGTPYSFDGTTSYAVAI